MQPRLMRSRTEVILAGVCGGLGEYFGIDPVIVRLIFVLVTLTTGLGIIVYPVLWLVMPKAGAPMHTNAVPPSAGQRYIGAQPEQQVVDEQGNYVFQSVARERQAVSQSRPAGPRMYPDPPAPTAYNFDPITGQPLQGVPPATGQTIHLPNDPTQQPLYVAPQAPAPVARPRRGRWLAFVLIGLGALILADRLGFDTDLVFPILMIGAGLLLIRRR